MAPDLIEQMIASVPWARLAHAYGPASDVPDRLRRVRDWGPEPDQDDLADLDDLLFWAVVHQAVRPSSAATPVLWILRRIIADDRQHPAWDLTVDAVATCAQLLVAAHDQPHPRFPFRSEPGEVPWASRLPPERPLRVGDDKADYFLAEPAEYDILLTAVHDWTASILPAFDTRPAVSKQVVRAGAAFIQLDAESPFAHALEAVTRDPEATALVRADAIVVLGTAGRDVSAWLGDDDPLLAVAAALVTPSAPGAVDILIDALGDVDWLESAIPRGFATLDWSARIAIERAIMQAVPFEAASEPCMAALSQVLAEHTSGGFTASIEWGPILKWAFPDRVQPGNYQKVPPPDTLSDRQRRILAALADNPNLWSVKDGNAGSAFAVVGLPHDRESIGRLVAETP